MSYTAGNLDLFEPLLRPEEREGTSYFELHPQELPRPYSCWLPGSFLLRDAAFDFFSECFHAASGSFDYFSSQRFDEIETMRLLDELEQFLDVLAYTPSRLQLFSRYASISRPDIWQGVETGMLASKVYECGVKMHSFVKLNTQESKCLWVLGM